MPSPFRNNTAQNRYELDADGHIAAVFYRLSPGVVTLIHTEVASEVEGRGIGSRVVRAALEDARAQGLKVVPRCSFVSHYISRHREFHDLLA